MPRAPFQALFMPCRHDGTRWLFAVFLRANCDMWQGIAGGGEDDETPLEAAAREANEEAGIAVGTPLIPLDAMACIRANCFPAEDWGDDVYVIPEYSFDVVVRDEQFTLSSEHRAYEWLDAEAAMERLTFDSNRTAIWELHERLTRGSSSGEDHV